MRVNLVPVFALILLSACSGNSGPAVPFGAAMNSKVELELIPKRPLDFPPSLILPVPTPGGVNRADQAARP